ncbi:protein translocase SEC61 complex subunit gamma [Candidatus Micrarchaeota archaeon]|nr:protein translocase SEC61 complex subunit gamma [Candidatus Micrarchaeota archaeon]
MDLKYEVENFIQQSQRIIEITYKPKANIYKQMAMTTALGVVLIGVFGFVISMVAYFATRSV